MATKTARKPHKSRENRGRPALPEGESRGIELRVRARQGEIDSWREAAGAAGQSLSEWCRAALNQALAR